MTKLKTCFKKDEQQWKDFHLAVTALTVCCLKACKFYTDAI